MWRHAEHLRQHAEVLRDRVTARAAEDDPLLADLLDTLWSALLCLDLALPARPLPRDDEAFR